MLKRYSIWDKQTPVQVPTGAIFTPEQWIEKYPIAGVPTIYAVIGAPIEEGLANGCFFGTLGQMVKMAENEGADFSNAKTPEEKLEVFEAWEDARNQPDPDYISNEELSATALASIAASMEFQNMMMLDDVEE